jgi:hypothetical protein
MVNRIPPYAYTPATKSQQIGELDAIRGWDGVELNAVVLFITKIQFCIS